MQGRNSSHYQSAQTHGVTYISSAASRLHHRGKQPRIETTHAHPCISRTASLTTATGHACSMPGMQAYKPGKSVVALRKHLMHHSHTAHVQHSSGPCLIGPDSDQLSRQKSDDGRAAEEWVFAFVMLIRVFHIIAFNPTCTTREDATLLVRAPTAPLLELRQQNVISAHALNILFGASCC